MRKICDYGLKKIKQWEGLKTHAYQDEVGVWTIGYGHTRAAGYPFPEKNMVISIDQAENILKKDLIIYEKTVEDSVKVSLNDFQFAALVSFCYNVGTKAFLKSTLLKKLNNEHLASVPDEFLRWVIAGGKTSQGLINRRRAEVALWNKGEFIASNYICAEKQKDLPEQCQTALPIASSLSGFASIFAGNGVIQWVLAIGCVCFFFISFYFIWKKYKMSIL